MSLTEYEKVDESDRAFYENAFYWTSSPKRFRKILAHWELYRRTLDVPGVIIELGVFKGPSLIRLAAYQSLLGDGRALYGFDTFGTFPETQNIDDKEPRRKFVELAGDTSIGVNDLRDILDRQSDNNVILVEGDICETLPSFVDQHRDMSVAMVHLDVDIYEPSLCAVKTLWPLMSPGAIMMLDDYDTFPGQCRAVHEAIDNPKVQTLEYTNAPTFMVKE